MIHTLFLAPFPRALPLAVLLPLAALVVGIGRRVAGGVLNQWAAALGLIGAGGRVMGDLPARAIYGAAVAVAALAAGGAWACAGAMPLVIIGCAVPMWAIDPLGDGYSTPVWLRCLGNGAHGVLSMLPVTAGRLVAWAELVVVRRRQRGDAAGLHRRMGDRANRAAGVPAWPAPGRGAGRDVLGLRDGRGRDPDRSWSVRCPKRPICRPRRLSPRLERSTARC